MGPHDHERLAWLLHDEREALVREIELEWALREATARSRAPGGAASGRSSQGGDRRFGDGWETSLRRWTGSLRRLTGAIVRSAGVLARSRAPSVDRRPSSSDSPDSLAPEQRRSREADPACQAEGSRRGSTSRPAVRTAPIPPRTS